MQLLTSPMPLSSEVIDDRVATVLEAGTNITLNYDDTANVLTISAATSASGAPTDAEYVTSSVNGTLSAERVLTDTATVTWDRTTPGQMKANAAAGTSYTDEQAQDAVGNIIADSATIDFLYDDTTPSISGFVKDNSITEPMLNLSDNTTKNSSISTHGLLPKLSGSTVTFLRGDGTWATPYTDEQVQDTVAALLVAGANIILTYDDVANTLTIASSGGTAYTNEEAQDAVGTILIDSARIDFTYSDATPSITADIIAGSITETQIGLSDVTFDNATTLQHGFLPKLSGSAATYLDGTGAWTAPSSAPINYATIGATIQRNIVQSLVTVVSTPIIFTVEVRDDSSFWNSGTPTRITVPITGWYTITVFIQWDSSTANYRQTAIRVNGTTNIALVSEGSATSNQQHTLAVSWYFMASDYIEILAYHNAASNRTVETCSCSIIAITDGTNLINGAPVDAQYITSASHANLSAERVLANGVNTSWDFSTPGVAILNITPALGTMAQQDASAVAITGGSATGLGVLTVMNGLALNVLRGQVIVGEASVSTAGCPLEVIYRKASVHGILVKPNDTDTGPGVAIQFLNTSAGSVGSINTNATVTTYNTTSDARLKHAITPLTGALDVVRRLRPITHLWRADDSRGYGFVAHEVQDTLPADAGVVTGARDALDEKGQIIPQQIDYGKLVPWLTAALQESLMQVEALTKRMISLEHKLSI